jgi:Fur family zinc uptake transcriptional regulator
MSARDPGPELSRNETLVLHALEQVEGPLSAYAILDQLRDEGLRAPMQVYRALEKLVASRRVHRLETLNAYVACCHAHRHEGAVVFAICDGCGEVVEWSDEAVESRLDAQAGAHDFRIESAIVELRGTCAACRAGA